MKALFLILILCTTIAEAALQIPSNLNQRNRSAILDILGFGTVSKILNDPYPLGGYSGFEFGVSSDLLSTTEISTLGSGSVGQAQTNYYLFSLGKGIYNNIDTFVNFALFSQQESIANFGLQFRWGFYEAQYLPIYLSLVAHMNTTNFQNLISTKTQGFDIIAAFKEGDVTLFFGTGYVDVVGTFSGGSGGITDTGETVTQSALGQRLIGGTNIKFGDYFLALELDRTNTTVYSAKFGVRY